MPALIAPMIRCTHSACGHSWLQILLPAHTKVDTCPLCEEEDEEADEERLRSVREQDEAKAKYYHEKYGDPL